MLLGINRGMGKDKRKAMGFSAGSDGQESACNAGDLGLIPRLGKSQRGGKGYPLQCSGLENSKHCVVNGVAESQTRLSDFYFQAMERSKEKTRWENGK